MNNEDRFYPFEQVRARISKDTWKGNVVKPGLLMTDGHLLFRTKAVKKKADVERLLARPRRDNYPQRSQGMAAELFRDHTRASTTPVEIIGVYDTRPNYGPPLPRDGSSTDAMLLVDAKGEARWVNALKLAYFHRIIGFDGVFVDGARKGVPLVLKQKRKAVGLILPLRSDRVLGKGAIQVAREQVEAARTTG